MAGQASELLDKFRWRFPNSGNPRVFRAPGRINLIGDHTDYNFGLVMPMAIDLSIWIVTAPNNSGVLRFRSEDLQKSHEVPLSVLANTKPRGDWSDYVVGTAIELQRAGVALIGQDVLIESRLPMGAGLSSSAALEAVTALALMGDHRFDRLELAKLCQRAENQFAGTPCGLMDQYAVIFGREGGAIKLDCLTLESENVMIPRGVVAVAVNSMVKRELASSEYASRRRECENMAELLSRKYPHVRSLRDATPEMLQGMSVDEIPVKRARHVVSENMRVNAFAQACRRNNPTAMGTYLVQSHRSLRDDYNVSCAELDFLVESACELAGVYGARMMGGGFGGCTINLVDRASVPEFRTRIRHLYQYRYGVDPQVFICEPSAGASQFG